MWGTRDVWIIALGKNNASNSLGQDLAAFEKMYIRVVESLISQRYDTLSLAPDFGLYMISDGKGSGPDVYW